MGYDADSDISEHPSPLVSYLKASGCWNQYRHMINFLTMLPYVARRLFLLTKSTKKLRMAWINREWGQGDCLQLKTLKN